VATHDHHNTQEEEEDGERRREGAKPPELLELAREEDGTPIIFFTIAVWHGIALTQHGLTLSPNCSPISYATTVSTLGPPFLLAAMSPPWMPLRSLYLGEAKLAFLLFCQVALVRTHTRAKVQPCRATWAREHWRHHDALTLLAMARPRHGVALFQQPQAGRGRMSDLASFSSSRDTSCARQEKRRSPRSHWSCLPHRTTVRPCRRHAMCVPTSSDHLA